MRAAFRADASREMGTGHVMRCLTLADELKGRGWDTLFLGKPFEGNLLERIREQGHRAMALPAGDPETARDPHGTPHSAWLHGTQADDANACMDALATQVGTVDWLLVDHYALDARWERALRPVVRGILVIDDMADRPHACDILLDQNLREDGGSDYDTFLPGGCRRLLGPEFALLRPEFAEARATLAPRSIIPKTVLIFLGGSDPNNHTGKCLEALDSLGRPDLEWTVIIGPSNPHGEALQIRWDRRPGTIFLRDARSMGALLAASDLALAGGGVNTWERLCLGLPAVTVSIALNQEGLLAAAAARGLVDYAGRASDLTTEDIARRVGALLADNPRRADMADRALAAVDGRGRIRVSEAMMRP